MAKTAGRHHLRVIEPDGDYWRAACLGCEWKGELRDTKPEARDDHTEHLTEALLGRLGKLDPTPDGADHG